MNIKKRKCNLFTQKNDYTQILNGLILKPIPGSFDIQDDKASFKFNEEFLLNAVNQRGSSYTGRNFVDSPPTLIRRCNPSTLKEWIEYYFANAVENKKNGEPVTIDKIIILGQKLKVRLEDNFSKMGLSIPKINELTYFAYIYNLTLLRTWDGHFGEESVHNWLEESLNKRLFSTKKMDTKYGVDRFIRLSIKKRIGIQVKPTGSRAPLHNIVKAAHDAQHKKFQEDFGGKVFWIYYSKDGVIKNDEVLVLIKQEIDRLSKS